MPSYLQPSFPLPIARRRAHAAAMMSSRAGEERRGGEETAWGPQGERDGGEEEKGGDKKETEGRKRMMKIRGRRKGEQEKEVEDPVEVKDK